MHGYVDAHGAEVVTQRAVFSTTPMAIRTKEASTAVAFDYHHGLETPRIYGVAQPLPEIEVSARHIVRFGMLEGDARVHGDRVVYDPQNAQNPRPFHENGSTARELALVLNQHEASLMTGKTDVPVEEMARELLQTHKASVVVIKRGPRGALVFDGTNVHAVPAYRSQEVWKIGSGDNFVAHFAHQWMQRGRTPAESADLASRATAFYCETRSFAAPESLAAFNPPAITVSERYAKGWRPTVYLAGPFFTLAQLWLVEQARGNLRSMGLTVFSPYHDVGLGSADDVVSKDLDGIRRADFVFAIGDGLDSGTIYEIGFARALNKPVIVYCENESEENKKMIEGSGCTLTKDYVGAVYQAVWLAAGL
ncbi:pfkB family carbohydrate kinase [Variovorax sp. YR750]|nr:pfkB family carbohydrate kinase [Variovorax sp. YR750]